MSPRPGLVDSSSSGSSSSLSNGSEKENLREFARKLKAQLNPTESNPSMGRRSSMNSSERLSVFRRPSLADLEVTEENALASPGRSNSTKKKNSRKSRNLSMRNAFRKTVQKVVGKKSVSFACDKRLFDYQYVDTVKEMKNIELIWFTSAEMDGCKRDAQRLADALEVQDGLGGVIDHDDWRGLENHGEDGNWKAYKARSDVVNAVLDVQDQFQSTKIRRRQSNAVDAVTLMAKAAREVSFECVEQAVERACQDADYANEYCQDIVAMIQAIPLPSPRPEQPVPQKRETPRGRSRRRMRFSIQSKQ